MSNLRDRRPVEDRRLARAAGAWPRLTLRQDNLTEREIAKIGAFLREGRHRFLCDWSLVFDGQCHVLALGDSQPGSALGANRDAAAILRLHQARDEKATPLDWPRTQD